MVAERKAKRLRRREDRQQELIELWLERILPEWDNVSAQRLMREPRVAGLFREGIPPRIRSYVWPQATGNETKATPELCEPLVTAAQTMLADALAAKVDGLRSNASHLEERAHAAERCCTSKNGTHA